MTRNFLSATSQLRRVCNSACCVSKPCRPENLYLTSGKMPKMSLTSNKEKLKLKLQKFMRSLDASSDESDFEQPVSPVANPPVPPVAVNPPVPPAVASTPKRPSLSHQECKNLFKRGGHLTVPSSLRAAFAPYGTPSTSSPAQPPSKKHKIVANTCTLGKQLVLIPFAADLGAPNKNDISVLSKLQLVKNSVTVSSVYTADGLKSFLKFEFKPLLDHIDFELLIKEGGDLISPQLQEGSSLTSKKASQIFHQKKVFLRPTEDLAIDISNVMDILNKFKPKQKFVIFNGYLFYDLKDFDTPNEEEARESPEDSCVPPANESNNMTESTAASCSSNVHATPSDRPSNIQSAAPASSSMVEVVVSDVDGNYIPLDGFDDIEWCEVTGTEADLEIELGTETEPLAVLTPAAFQDIQELTVKEIIKDLGRQIISEQQRPLYISRSNVFRSAHIGLNSPLFDPKKALFIKFVDQWNMDEIGIDTGGLRNEFFRLALQEIKLSRMFEGEELSRSLALDADSLRLEDYKLGGMIMALSTAHNGPSPQFLSPELYDMIVSGEYDRPVDISKIMDEDIRKEIETITNTKNIRELEYAVTNSLLLTMIGVTSVDNFRRKQGIINELMDYCLNIRLQPAFEQFCRGLKTLNVLEYIRKHPAVMRAAFVKPASVLTAANIKRMLDLKFSTDAELRRKEEQMATHLLYYLDDLEAGLLDASIEDFLILLTGHAAEPLGGFEKKLTVAFTHAVNAGDRPYPTASSCALRLTLPVFECTYEEFKEKMNETVKTKYFGIK